MIVLAYELRTLRTQDTSDPGHFGTSLVGPNCPDRSALVPKCPKDSSDVMLMTRSRRVRLKDADNADNADKDN